MQQRGGRTQLVPRSVQLIPRAKYLHCDKEQAEITSYAKVNVSVAPYAIGIKDSQTFCGKKHNLNHNLYFFIGRKVESNQSLCRKYFCSQLNEFIIWFQNYLKNPVMVHVKKLLYSLYILEILVLEFKMSFLKIIKCMKLASLSTGIWANALKLNKLTLIYLKENCISFSSSQYFSSEYVFCPRKTV